MNVNPEFIEMIERRYKEMIDNNIIEDYLNEKIFGELKIFINKKPKHLLYSVEISADKVYIGEI